MNFGSETASKSVNLTDNWCLGCVRLLARGVCLVCVWGVSGVGPSVSQGCVSGVCLGCVSLLARGVCLGCAWGVSVC